MMHDFSLTEKHVVFYDLPVTFDAALAAEMTMPKPLRLPARLMMWALTGCIYDAVTDRSELASLDAQTLVAERQVDGRSGTLPI